MSGKKIKKKIIHGFTLLELIVAMGIFSVLMLMLMQFFSSAQQIWTSSEKRNTVYADARIAMDLMSSVLQTTFYRPDAVPFCIVPGNDFDRIVFVSKTGTKLYEQATSDLFAVSFWVNNSLDNGKLLLCIRMFGDDKYNAYDIFNSLSSLNLLCNRLGQSNTDANPASVTPQGSDIINYVTGLKFIPFRKDSTNGMVRENVVIGTYYRKVPYAIQIKLTLMDKNTYAKWKELGGKESQIPNEVAAAKKIREKNQHTFTRMVYLGDRNN
ncbi:MAG: prepilin-type N-terminal cleavage/methylation domain-containing protein [Victivallales bacterium]|nr:prepilin-type N-terminal cleavage/methylation domain-containing protein [Victivallales bacterium]